MRETLITALELTLGNEGAYVNNSNDIGGATKYGITYKALAAYRGMPTVSTEQVKSLTEKEAKEIYQSDYWVQSGGDILPVGIDYMAFDYSVHSGATQAVKSLQRVVGQAVDGIVSTKTINAVKSYKGDLISDYAAERLRFMRTLKSWKIFGPGWQKRVEIVSNQARHLISSEKSISQVILSTDKAALIDYSVLSMLKKPEFLASLGGLLSGLSAMATGSGPIQWALAIIMVGAFFFAIYFFIKRMKDRA